MIILGCLVAAAIIGVTIYYDFRDGSRQVDIEQSVKASLRDTQESLSALRAVVKSVNETQEKLVSRQNLNDESVSAVYPQLKKLQEKLDWLEVKLNAKESPKPPAFPSKLHIVFDPIVHHGSLKLEQDKPLRVYYKDWDKRPKVQPKQQSPVQLDKVKKQIEELSK